MVGESPLLQAGPRQGGTGGDASGRHFSGDGTFSEKKE